jgi:hypothetical protein
MYENKEIVLEEIENFNLQSIYVEHIHNITINFRRHNINFKLYINEDGYTSYNIPNDDDLPDDITEFLHKYYDEVKEKLIEIIYR